MDRLWRLVWQNQQRHLQIHIRRIIGNRYGSPRRRKSCYFSKNSKQIQHDQLHFPCRFLSKEDLLVHFDLQIPRIRRRNQAFKWKHFSSHFGSFQSCFRKLLAYSLEIPLRVQHERYFQGNPRSLHDQQVLLWRQENRIQNLGPRMSKSLPR